MNETHRNHLPADTQSALGHLCKISQSLLDLSERESQALIQSDMMTLEILQDEKEKLSQRYMMSSQEFQQRAHEFKDADKGLIRKLDDLQRKLGERAKDNNVLIGQIKERAERKTQKTLLMAQEYGQRKTTHFENSSATQFPNGE